MLLKIEPSEITPFFYNNFFRFRGGFSPFPIGYAQEKFSVGSKIRKRKGLCEFQRMCNLVPYLIRMRKENGQNISEKSQGSLKI